MWVSPFRYLRIDGYLLLPAAFRSLSRLSSALSAKASTLRSLCLTFVIRGTIVDGGFLMTCVNNLVSGHGGITAFRLLASDMACYQPWYHLRSKRHEQDRRSANAAYASSTCQSNVQRYILFFTLRLVSFDVLIFDSSFLSVCSFQGTYFHKVPGYISTKVLSRVIHSPSGYFITGCRPICVSMYLFLYASIVTDTCLHMHGSMPSWRW